MTLSIEALSVRRGGRVIFGDITLATRAGEIVGLVGPNGCGKSTLLSCIAGVLEPREGRVLIDGASVWGPHRDRTRSRASLGYVPEGADPPGFLTARELWALCATSRRTAPPSTELREQLGLDDIADLALERMSLGQRRRACLGAAFLGPPKLLVLDEPDNGLDVARLDALVVLLRDHARGGGATILASHDAAWLGQLGARVHTLTAR
ncbi:MAG: ABC transporter ATP-binding protein [Kofleriaceae bacterium]|nr:ABC transporter ATP-binding protein [Kofleriaceae bacterium]